MNISRHFKVLSILLLVAGLAACGGDDAADRGMTDDRAAEGAATSSELRVVDVDLGRSVDASGRVTSSTDDFNSTDTVYVSVATTGTGNGATLTARWTYENGQVVDETSQTISPTGPANTEFHISMPGGLPAGDYSVEILLDGRSVETESFEVE